MSIAAPESASTDEGVVLFWPTLLAAPDSQGVDVFIVATSSDPDAAQSPSERMARLRARAAARQQAFGDESNSEEHADIGELYYLQFRTDTWQTE